MLDSFVRIGSIILRICPAPVQIDTIPNSRIYNVQVFVKRDVYVTIIITIIIINEEIIVAFSPRTTRTRYKVKHKTARYVVSSSIEKQLVRYYVGSFLTASLLVCLIWLLTFSRFRLPLFVFLYCTYVLVL